MRKILTILLVLVVSGGFAQARFTGVEEINDVAPLTAAEKTQALVGSTTVDFSAARIQTAAGTAALPAITPAGDVDTGVWFPAADTIGFSTNGAEGVRLSASGELLVGSTADQGDFKLQVAGGVIHHQVPSFIIATDTYAATKRYLQISDLDNTGSIDFQSYVFADTTANSAPITFHTSSASGRSEKLRISANGSVGIATTTPDASTKLHVVGDVRVDGLPEYADNAAAVADGLAVGRFYHTAGVLKVVIP